MKLLLKIISMSILWIGFSVSAQFNPCKISSTRCTAKAQQDSGKNYLDYCFECVEALDISDECKRYKHFSHGVNCIKDTKQKACSSFFDVVVKTDDSLPDSISQLVNNMVICSGDSSEWENASDEKIAELLTQYAECVEPLLEQFKSENNCN